MNNSNFKSIFEINLLYLNPSLTAKIRKKGEKSTRAVAKKILLKHIVVMSVVIAVLYSSIFIPKDFSKQAYIFDRAFVILFILNIVSGISSYFNIFYESKDTESFMSLPVSQKDLYLAKLATTACGGIPASMALFPLYISFFMSNGYGVAGVLYSIAGSIIAILFIVSLEVIISGAVSGISFLSKHRETIQMGVNILVTILSIFVILYIQFQNRQYLDGTIKTEGVVTGPLSALLMHHTGVMIFLGIQLAIVVLVYVFYILSMENNFYDQVRKTEGNLAKKKNKARPRDGNSLFRILFRYNKGLLKEQTVIMGSIITPGLIPVVFMISMLLNQDGNLLGSLYGNRFFTGVFLGTLTGLITSTSPANLGAIIFSAEGQDYEFMKSLPIGRKKYFNIKLFISVLFPSFIPLTALVLYGIYSKSIVIGLSSVVFYIITVIPVTSLWIIFDLNHLETDRQNLTELYGRVSKALSILIFTGMIIIFFVTVIVAIFLGKKIIFYAICASIFAIYVLNLVKLKKRTAKGF